MYDLNTLPDLSLEEEDLSLRTQPLPPAPAQPPPPAEEMEVIDKLPEGAVPIPSLAAKQPAAEEMEVIDKLPEGSVPIEGAKPIEDTRRDVGIGESASRGVSRGILGLSEMLSQYVFAPFVHGAADLARGVAPDTSIAKYANEADEWWYSHMIKGQEEMRKSLAIDPRTEKQSFLAGTAGVTGEMAPDIIQAAAMPEVGAIRAAAGLRAAIPEIKGAAELAPTIWNTVKSYIPNVQHAMTSFVLPAARAGMDAQNTAAAKGANEVQQIGAFVGGFLESEAAMAIPLAARSELANPLLRFASRSAQSILLAGGQTEAARDIHNIFAPYFKQDAQPFEWKSFLQGILPMGLMGGFHGGHDVAPIEEVPRGTISTEAISPPPPETVRPPAPVGDERFAPPGVTITPAPGEVPTPPDLAPPPPPPAGDWKTDQYLRRGIPPSPEPAPVSAETRLQGIDTELATATDPARRQALEAEKVVINHQIQTRTDAEKAQATAENLRASNAPQTAAAVEAATAGHVSSEHEKLQAAIESVTPPEVFAPGQAPAAAAAAPAPAMAEAPKPAAPVAEVPAAAPPAAAPPEAKIPYVPSEPQRPMPTGTEARFKDAVKLIRQGDIQQARVVMADILQNYMFYEGQTKLPHMPGTAKDWVEGQRPLNQAHNDEIRRRINEMEMYTHPNAEYEGQASTGTHQATVIRPSEQINRHLEGVTVDVPMIDERGKPSVYRQNAADALRDLKRDRTGLELLINCL